MIDVIIPTIPGREESLKRAVASYEAAGDVSTVVVRDSPTCGDGWREGFRRSTAPYVLFASDDHECRGIEPCVETVEEGFIPCPRVWTPAGTIESNGGDMDAWHHTISRPQRDRKPVDYTTIPFLSREWAEQIGMPEDLHYCCDVWVSYRARQLGIATILRHGYEIVHHQEQVGRGAGMPQEERDERDETRMREELAKCAV